MCSIDLFSCYIAFIKADNDIIFTIFSTKIKVNVNTVHFTYTKRFVVGGDVIGYPSLFWN